MTLNEINELWAEDSKIDKINLGDESIKTTSLHHKYLQIYSKEKLILAKRKAEYNTLKLEKFNFIEVVEGYIFSSYWTIRRCHLYFNSQMQNKMDYQNRERIFFNISKNSF